MDDLAADKGGSDEQAGLLMIPMYLDLALTPAKLWVNPVSIVRFLEWVVIGACGVLDTSCDQANYRKDFSTLLPRYPSSY